VTRGRVAAVALTCALLVSCAGVRSLGGPRAYAQESGLNTPTSACAANPLNCTALTGVVPEGGGLLQTVASAGLFATVVAINALETTTRDKVDQVVKECADMARADVLVRLFDRKSPTPDQCREKVVLPNGTRVERYKYFGREMHATALQCVKRRLGELIPGHFSIEPRYRYDERSRQTIWIPPEEVDQIYRDRRWADLEGTIKPDLVIHGGNARYVREVYDFKFPCVNTDDKPSWRSGPAGDGSQDQDAVYRDLLGKHPAMVVPILGIFR
jgi:hypothetical protein